MDALHDTATVDGTLDDSLDATFGDDQLLDLLLLCGWYHAISFGANGAPRFADFDEFRLAG